MPTTISDPWIPDIWVRTMREKQATFPTLVNSGVVVDNPRATELASGPGEVATIPFFKDITDQEDEIQVENAEPTVENKITSDQMNAVACKTGVQELGHRIRRAIVWRRSGRRDRRPNGAARPLINSGGDQSDAGRPC